MSQDTPPPEMSDPRKTQAIVGNQMRGLRKAKGLSLQSLAQKTDLSVGYLSQLERNLATPSIRALSTIARALGVNISWFFPEDDDQRGHESGVVVRAENRRSLSFASGIRDELLCPSLSGQLEMLLCTLEPGARSGDLYTHTGEEAGFVGSGQLELRVDDDVFLLRAGDSFHFDCSRPHGYRNPGDVTTTVIWAVTPPHY